MTVSTLPPILPYGMIVGQDSIKRALELAYIADRIGGVLISGQRGTGKSTLVRAFAQMMYTKPLVTLPINATEDRVVGGWQIKQLMEGTATPQDGLLQGRRAGDATDQFNIMQGNRAMALTEELENIKFSTIVEDTELSLLWATRNDARNFAWLGDPACRLPFDPPLT